MVHHDVVVWYDPDRHYTPVAQGLTISNTTVVQYEGSFFALRHQVEPLLERLDPPRLMVYVPLDQADAHHALVELETAGVVMKPGQQPPTRNTRLSLIARNALAPILGREKVMEIERQVEAGQLSLAAGLGRREHRVLVVDLDPQIDELDALVDYGSQRMRALWIGAACPKKSANS